MEIDEDGSSSSSSEGDETETKLLTRCQQLEDDLAVNMYNYVAHTDLVNAYRQLADLKSMRQAYKRFYEHFPLTPELWMSWITDEIKVMHTDNDREFVRSLYEKAVQDYVSVNVWLSFAQFEMETSLQTGKQVLERAINAAGLHFRDSYLLWDSLRDIVLAEIGSASGSADVSAEQLAEIINIFGRQLSVPHQQLEDVYSKWKTFKEQFELDKAHVDPVEWKYQQAKKEMQKCRMFEDQLAEEGHTANEILSIYRQYIVVMDNPSAKVMLFERAIVENCLDAPLWSEYIKYMNRLQSADTLKVIERALRNCPWVADLWICKMEYMEQHSSEGDVSKTVMACFEEAASCLGGNSESLWSAYLEFAQRNSKSDADVDKLYKLFDQALEILSESELILRWYARLLARNGNVAKCREIWRKILSYPDNQANVVKWLEIINLERAYGTEKSVREMYQRAVKHLHKDSNQLYYAKAVVDQWILYEREIGPALGKVREIEILSKQIQEEYDETFKVASNKSAKPQNGDSVKRKLSQVNLTAARNHASKRSKEDVAPQVKSTNFAQKDPKRTVFVSNLHPGINENRLKEVFPNAKNIELVFDRSGKSRCYGYVEFEDEKSATEAKARDRELLDNRPMFLSDCKVSREDREKVFRYSINSEENKLFVRNIPLHCSQEEVDAVFKPFGATDVRLVLHKNGHSKGLAYVEFENAQHAKEALQKTDGIEMGNQKLVVAISKPPQKNTSGQSSSSKSLSSIPASRSYARSRLSVPLIPRAVVQRAAANQEETSAVQNLPSNGTTAKKTNDDFRKMFLG